MKDTFVGIVIAVLNCAIWMTSVEAIERVAIERDGRRIHLSGKCLVEAEDGGMLLVAPNGVLWIIQPEEIASRESDDTAFKPLSEDEIAEQLLDELPTGFRIHQTANYIICYNTSEAYAQWCGGLYERLNRGFYRYWTNLGFELRKPEFPLVALVFDDHRSYAQYARDELGAATSSIIGYYNMGTNRVTMYDLTGADELRRHQRRISTAAHINQILMQPAAERTVATIVHEATHQLAYNSGLQTRYAGNPFWVSEGIAVFFETPDLRSSRGWQKIGSVNHVHLTRFRQSMNNRSPEALVTLLTDDSRFRDPQSSPEAYADAWALNYYLLRARRREYVRYLKGPRPARPVSGTIDPTASRAVSHGLWR
jgi:hypothetical protein